VITSQKEQFLSEIQDPQPTPIPPEKLAYFRARLKNRLYDYVASRLIAERQSGTRSVSQSDLAKRLSKKPEQITRWLGAPGNWTLETLSDLLLAISGNELPLPNEEELVEQKRNSNGPNEWVNRIKVGGDNSTHTSDEIHTTSILGYGGNGTVISSSIQIGVSQIDAAKWPPAIVVQQKVLETLS
jgi:hypothetical protein